MYTVALLHMPFARIDLPSIALTQLKAVVEERCPDQVDVHIVYANHDFARYLGLELNADIITTSTNIGLGDWFFRQLAFPEVADNPQEYFQRVFPLPSPEIQRLKQVVQEKRAGLGAFLDELISRYELDQMDLVGFTSAFSQNVASFAMARRVKERNPKVMTIIGGPNCEYPMGQEMAEHVPAFDFVFSGPSLQSFPEFVQAQIEHRPAAVQAINGIFSKDRLMPARVAGDERNINQPVPLDYDGFLHSLETAFPDDPIDPCLLFETSRGCWWGERSHCTFCGINGTAMKFRAMTPDTAVPYFHELFHYSSRAPYLLGVDNILEHSYLKDVLPRLDTPADMTIFYEIKANLKEADIQTLAKARVKFIQPGIESLASSTLKLMKKGCTAFQNVRLLKYCAMYDVDPMWNILIGFPGETERTLEKYLTDIPLLVHLPAPLSLVPVRFDRFSPYFTQAKEMGLQLKPFDFYELVYPFDQKSLANLAYFFMDNNFEAAYIGSMARWFTPLTEKIQQWKNLWNAEAHEPIATLYFTTQEGQTLIHDSRSGEPKQYPIRQTTRQLLEYLNDPADAAKIQTYFTQQPDFDAEKELALIRDKGLVFEEEGRMLNLVLPSPPPQRESMGDAIRVLVGTRGLRRYHRDGKGLAA